MHRSIKIHMGTPNWKVFGSEYVWIAHCWCVSYFLGKCIRRGCMCLVQIGTKKCYTKYSIQGNNKSKPLYLHRINDDHFNGLKLTSVSEGNFLVNLSAICSGSETPSISSLATGSHLRAQNGGVLLKIHHWFRYLRMRQLKRSLATGI